MNEPPGAALQQLKPDWYCEKLHCWMLKSACESRQQRAFTGSYESRSKYISAGCGNCKQVSQVNKQKRIRKMDEQKVETVIKKTCKGPCGRTLPLTDFGVSANTLDGREGKCKECRRASQNANYRKRTAGTQKIGKKSKGLPARKKVEEYVLPHAVSLSGVGLPITTSGAIDDPERSRTLISTLEKDTISVNFSKYPDILQAVSDMAETEFRSPEMQVLYLLKRQINDEGILR